MSYVADQVFGTPDHSEPTAKKRRPKTVKPEPEWIYWVLMGVMQALAWWWGNPFELQTTGRVLVAVVVGHLAAFVFYRAKASHYLLLAILSPIVAIFPALGLTLIPPVLALCGAYDVWRKSR